ncbi:MAG TPA: hypothetical protein VMZ11_07655, partial [Mycobacteriales bacterium]|nr:hypothetical protein [Mycobacteriales bacterium]
PLPFAPPVSTGVGPAPVPSRNGVFLVDLQAITGPATVTVSDSEGHRASGPLASGTSQPNLTVPDAPALPPTWRAVLSTQGQTERHSTGGWATPSFSSAPSGTSQRVQTAIVRCYGGGTLHVTLKLGEKGVLAAEGDVPCDGESHQAFAAVDVGDVQEHLEVRGDRLQVMNLAFGSLS